VIALVIYWNQVYEILFRFVQIWHFYCTMSRRLLFSKYRVLL